MENFTQTQIDLIINIFMDMEEFGNYNIDDYNKLMELGIDYNNVIMDNDGGIHYPGYNSVNPF